jgi:hypothetical protein
MILRIFIQGNSKFKISSMRSYGELQYAQNDTDCSSLAFIKPKLWPHGIKKQVKIITFIVGGIREPTKYVTILFAEYKITLSKTD